MNTSYVAAHAHHHHGLDARRADSRRRMQIALAINAGMLVAAVVGGILTGLAGAPRRRGPRALGRRRDLCSASAAAALASRSGGPRSTFGLQRTEVLAALVNGLALIAIAVLIAIAAIGRLSDPPDIDAGGGPRRRPAGAGRQPGGDLGAGPAATAPT